MAALLAEFLALGHILFVASTSHAYGRSGALPVLSTFLSANPLEYPALLWASGSVAAACASAGRVGLGGSFRGLYLGLLVAGLCGILSGSGGALTAQISALAAQTPAFLLRPALVAYALAMWIGGIYVLWEVGVAARALLVHGLPGRPRRALKGSGSSKSLPRLYAFAEVCCFLEMLRSPGWRAARLLPVAAALDTLRRTSGLPEQLCDPEPAQLNRAASCWAVASLAEGILLGVASTAWARRLGSTGAAAAAVGVVSALVTALPAAAVLYACVSGWLRSESTLASITKSKPDRRRKRWGQFTVEELEPMYLKAIGCFYRRFYPSMQREDVMEDFDYYLLKARLQDARSSVLRLHREDIKRELAKDSMEPGEPPIPRAAETQRWVESSSERYGARADEPEEAKAKAAGATGEALGTEGSAARPPPSEPSEAADDAALAAIDFGTAAVDAGKAGDAVDAGDASDAGRAAGDAGKAGDASDAGRAAGDASKAGDAGDAGEAGGASGAGEAGKAGDAGKVAGKSGKV